jgi:hypothetical protein
MYCGDLFAATIMTPEALRQRAKEAQEIQHKRIKEEIRKCVIEAADNGYMDAITEAYYIPYRVTQEIIQEYTDLGFKVTFSDSYDREGFPQRKYKFCISWKEDEVSG